ncbi:hypothetical protein L1987_36357 [Smallanthus sonchifolius]|uniref:Uncharacterized protein n=1 Tax=Smallanthus sonchifolius TaxID=185202 RepID=A0ACB9HEP6_9ASTR|nr:hypothetical protein L1987_36357 [Smallanthus sonchifolius]
MMFGSGDGFSSPPITNPNPNSSNSAKRKRNLPGNPDPDAEVIALSPNSLMATNRFVCEICSKGFQRDQNLQLHRRGHNLPWKLKQRNKQEVVRKKVYVCPEKSCVHHDPCRALGDLTGVKKHFSRKHGEKKWKCEKCSKKYAVKSDWKAHSKICGTREYKCDCGTLFSRKDSFVTHRAFCDALTEDNSRNMASFTTTNLYFQNDNLMKPRLPIWLHQHHNNIPLVNSTTTSSTFNNNGDGINLSSEMMHWLSTSQETSANFGQLPQGLLSLKEEQDNTKQLNIPFYNNYGGCSKYNPPSPPPPPPPHMSATGLLQQASQMGSTNSGGFGLMNTISDLSGFDSLNQSVNLSGGMMNGGDGLMMMMMAGLTQKTGEGNLTRDFLGVEDQVMKFSCSMNESSIGFSGNQ